ncbi:hypothetical protein [Streptomyces formicae]|uniref:hypothetical protein n=1 Tax=Streptomyces formicae TaxID=1616117 RepID=UPI001F56388E|nr:hypothetical protein [Streptomyces formicae]
MASRALSRSSETILGRMPRYEATVASGSSSTTAYQRTPRVSSGSPWNAVTMADDASKRSGPGAAGPGAVTSAYSSVHAAKSDTSRSRLLPTAQEAPAR